MKKIIAISLLGISLCLANECPDLSKGQNKDYVTGLKSGLEGGLPLLAKTYYDAVKSYNNTENIDNHINGEELQKYGATYTYGRLIAINYMLDMENKKTNLTNEEKDKSNKFKELLNNEYNRILTKIKPENKYWCTEEGIL